MWLQNVNVGYSEIRPLHSNVPPQESLLEMFSSTCKTHVENHPFWKHSWLCLTEKSDSGNGPSLWVWVNNFLLDSSNEALVLDCCVILVEHPSNPVFRQLGTYGVFESPPIRFIEVCSKRLRRFDELLFESRPQN